jgi:peptidoglycan hydrolase-like protein with peptidoglycan-binding domain
MRGEYVRGLQRILIGAGHLSGAADGIFGPQTEAAVKKPQAQLKVSADGIVGPESMPPSLACSPGSLRRPRRGKSRGRDGP